MLLMDALDCLHGIVIQAMFWMDMLIGVLWSLSGLL